METKTVILSVQEILNLGGIMGEFDRWGANNVKVPPLKEPFIQALVYNLLSIEPVIKEYQLLDEKSTEYIAYKKDVVKLERELALKGKEGKPVSVNGRYIPENLAEYELALFELREKHKEAYNQRMEKLNEKRELVLCRVEQRHVPITGIAISALKQLAIFIMPDKPETEITA